MNLTKLVQAILSRARERGGYVNKTKLVKYLYLFDVAAVRRRGHTLTGFAWIFFHYGPWTPEFEDLYKDLRTSGTITIRPSDRADFDTEFLSAPVQVELDEIIDDPTLEFTLKHIIDEWADVRLGEMLDFVYFHTEPMLNASRGERLDFDTVRGTPPPVSADELRSGRGGDTRAIDQMRRRISQRLTRTVKAPSPHRHTPARRDADYFEAERIVSEDDGY